MSASGAGDGRAPRLTFAYDRDRRLHLPVVRLEARVLEHLVEGADGDLDLINLTEAPRRAYQGWENASYTYYDPGFSVLVGVRGTF